MVVDYLTSALYATLQFKLLKNSRKFIVTIPVRNPWWKGFLLKKAKDLF